MKWIAIQLFSLVFLLLPSLPVVAELPPEIRWADPSSVRLDVDFPGNGYHASWVMFRPNWSSTVEPLLDAVDSDLPLPPG